MTPAQTAEVIAAIKGAWERDRSVVAVEFPRSLGLARGPWSILGVPLVYHSWYIDSFNLKLDGVGGFLYDDERHRFSPRALSAGPCSNEAGPDIVGPIDAVWGVEG